MYSRILNVPTSWAQKLSNLSKKVGKIALSVVPNNEVRSLNIYYKYADVLLVELEPSDF